MIAASALALANAVALTAHATSIALMKRWAVLVLNRPSYRQHISDSMTTARGRHNAERIAVVRNTFDAWEFGSEFGFIHRDNHSHEFDCLAVYV